MADVAALLHEYKLVVGACKALMHERGSDDV